MALIQQPEVHDVNNDRSVGRGEGLILLLYAMTIIVITTGSL